jgi:hypothetical protein
MLISQNREDPGETYVEIAEKMSTDTIVSNTMYGELLVKGI